MNSVPSVIIENDNSEKNNIVKELELALSEFNYKGNENLIFYKKKQILHLLLFITIIFKIFFNFFNHLKKKYDYFKSAHL